MFFSLSVNPISFNCWRRSPNFDPAYWSALALTLGDVGVGVGGVGSSVCGWVGAGGGVCGSVGGESVVGMIVVGVVVVMGMVVVGVVMCVGVSPPCIGGVVASMTLGEV